MSNFETKQKTSSVPLAVTPEDENDMIEINLVELWFLFCRKLKYIILAMILGGVVAGAGTYFFVAPKYTATSKLYIVSASSGSVVNLSDLQLGTNLAKDFEELIKSRPMMESTIQNLGLDISVVALSDMVTVSNPANTRILNISVTHTDPVKAEQIANEIAHLAVDWLAAVMESNEPNIVEEAVVPTNRSSPSYTKNTVVGALLLGMLFFGVCVVRYLMNDTISSEEEMERRFGIVPLAVIPEDLKASSSNAENGSSKKGNKKRGK